MLDRILSEPTESPFDLYQFHGEIGRGNFGTVRKCVCLRTNKFYACKIIRKTELKTAREVEEIRQEIAIMQKLQRLAHPNIVTLQGVYEDWSCVYLVMELCQGGELYDLIRASHFIEENRARQFFTEIAEATQFLHSQGVMHRDLKPENILLSQREAREEGGKEGGRRRKQQVKIVDFGLAIFLPPGKLTQGCAGSRFYESPEVICDNPYGHKADTWSLGVILYAMLSGRLPFLGETKRSLMSSICKGKVSFAEHPWPLISDAAKSLIRRMLTVDPEKRATVEEVLSDPWLNPKGVWNPPSPCGSFREFVPQRTKVDRALSSPSSASPLLPKPSASAFMASMVKPPSSVFHTSTPHRPLPPSSSSHGHLPPSSVQLLSSDSTFPPTTPTLKLPAARSAATCCSPNPPLPPWPPSSCETRPSISIPSELPPLDSLSPSSHLSPSLHSPSPRKFRGLWLHTSSSSEGSQSIVSINSGATTPSSTSCSPSSATASSPVKEKEREREREREREKGRGGGAFSFCCLYPEATSDEKGDGAKDGKEGFEPEGHKGGREREGERRGECPAPKPQFLACGEMKSMHRSVKFFHMRR